MQSDAARALQSAHHSAQPTTTDAWKGVSKRAGVQQPNGHNYTSWTRRGGDRPTDRVRHGPEPPDTPAPGPQEPEPQHPPRFLGPGSDVRKHRPGLLAGAAELHRPPRFVSVWETPRNYLTTKGTEGAFRRADPRTCWLLWARIPAGTGSVKTPELQAGRCVSAAQGYGPDGGGRSHRRRRLRRDPPDGAGRRALFALRAPPAPASPPHVASANSKSGSPRRWPGWSNCFARRLLQVQERLGPRARSPNTIMDVLAPTGVSYGAPISA